MTQLPRRKTRCPIQYGYLSGPPWQGDPNTPKLVSGLDRNGCPKTSEICSRGGDPLYRIRRLLNMAKEKLTEGANDKLTRFLEAGDPDNEVATAWRAKESLRELYAYRDPDLARDHLDALISDFTDNQRPPARSNYLGEP
ncbi:MAG: transposase [Ferrimicrobium acidiphilum]